MSVKGHPDIDVVLVDEAHYFRNEDSIDYDYLWRICQGKKVVLMTATPFSNRPLLIAKRKGIVV